MKHMCRKLIKPLPVYYMQIDPFRTHFTPEQAFTLSTLVKR